MRRGHRTHAHLARRLHAVQGGDAGVAQHRAPGGVGHDHQFGDQRIQRTATCAFVDADEALARLHRYAAAGLPINDEVVVLAIAVVGGFAAPGFKYLGEFPQQLQLVAIRKIWQTVGQRGFVEHRFDIVVTQVGDDRYPFHARLVAEQAEVGGDIQIERDRGHGVPGGEREMLDDVFRQHGDLAPGHIHRG